MPFVTTPTHRPKSEPITADESLFAIALSEALTSFADHIAGVALTTPNPADIHGRIDWWFLNRHLDMLALPLAQACQRGIEQDPFTVPGTALAKAANPPSVDSPDAPDKSLFTYIDQRAVQYSNERSGDLVTSVNTQVKETVKAETVRAVEGKQTVDQTARNLRQTVPVLPRHAQATTNAADSAYREAYAAAERRGDPDPQGAAESAAEATRDRLTDRYTKYRTKMIARTEIMASENMGRLASMYDAKASGVAGPDVVKKWVITSVGTCDQCAPYSGAEAEYNGTFRNGVVVPPLHPHCRCTVILARSTKKPRKSEQYADTWMQAGHPRFTQSRLNRSWLKRAFLFGGAAFVASPADDMIYLGLGGLALRFARDYKRRTGIPMSDVWQSILSIGTVGEEIGENLVHDIAHFVEHEADDIRHLFVRWDKPPVRDPRQPDYEVPDGVPPEWVPLYHPPTAFAAPSPGQFTVGAVPDLSITQRGSYTLEGEVAAWRALAEAAGDDMVLARDETIAALEAFLRDSAAYMDATDEIEAKVDGWIAAIATALARQETYEGGDAAHIWANNPGLRPLHQVLSAADKALIAPFVPGRDAAAFIADLDEGVMRAHQRINKFVAPLEELDGLMIDLEEALDEGLTAEAHRIMQAMTKLGKRTGVAGTNAPYPRMASAGYASDYHNPTVLLDREAFDSYEGQTIIGWDDNYRIPVMGPALDGIADSATNVNREASKALAEMMDRAGLLHNRDYDVPAVRDFGGGYSHSYQWEVRNMDILVELDRRLQDPDSNMVDELQEILSEAAPTIGGVSQRDRDLFYEDITHLMADTKRYMQGTGDGEEWADETFGVIIDALDGAFDDSAIYEGIAQQLQEAIDSGVIDATIPGLYRRLVDLKDRADRLDIEDMDSEMDMEWALAVMGRIESLLASATTERDRLARMVGKGDQIFHRGVQAISKHDPGNSDVKMGRQEYIDTIDIYHDWADPSRMFWGLGAYGHGLYHSWDWDEAAGYGATRGHSDGRGHVRTVKLKPDAKLITSGDLNARAEQARRRGEIPADMDDGVYAIMLGYDAINKTRLHHIVVLNRGATVTLDDGVDSWLAPPHPRDLADGTTSFRPPTSREAIVRWLNEQGMQEALETGFYDTNYQLEQTVKLLKLVADQDPEVARRFITHDRLVEVVAGFLADPRSKDGLMLRYLSSMETLNVEQRTRQANALAERRWRAFVDQYPDTSWDEWWQREGIVYRRRVIVDREEWESGSAVVLAPRQPPHPYLASAQEARDHHFDLQSRADQTTAALGREQIVVDLDDLLDRGYRPLSYTNPTSDGGWGDLFGGSQPDIWMRLAQDRDGITPLWQPPPSVVTGPPLSPIAHFPLTAQSWEAAWERPLERAIADAEAREFTTEARALRRFRDNLPMALMLARESTPQNPIPSMRLAAWSSLRRETRNLTVQNPTQRIIDEVEAIAHGYRERPDTMDGGNFSAVHGFRMDIATPTDTRIDRWDLYADDIRVDAEREMDATFARALEDATGVRFMDIGEGDDTIALQREMFGVLLGMEQRFLWETATDEDAARRAAEAIFELTDDGAVIVKDAVAYRRFLNTAAGSPITQNYPHPEYQALSDWYVAALQSHRQVVDATNVRQQANITMPPGTIIDTAPPTLDDLDFENLEEILPQDADHYSAFPDDLAPDLLLAYLDRTMQAMARRQADETGEDAYDLWERMQESNILHFPTGQIVVGDEQTYRDVLATAIRDMDNPFDDELNWSPETLDKIKVWLPLAMESHHRLYRAAAAQLSDTQIDTWWMPLPTRFGSRGESWDQYFDLVDGDLPGAPLPTTGISGGRLPHGYLLLPDQQTARSLTYARHVSGMGDQTPQGPVLQIKLKPSAVIVDRELFDQRRSGDLTGDQMIHETPTLWAMTQGIDAVAERDGSITVFNESALVIRRALDTRDIPDAEWRRLLLAIDPDSDGWEWDRAMEAFLNSKVGEERLESARRVYVALHEHQYQTDADMDELAAAIRNLVEGDSPDGEILRMLVRANTEMLGKTLHDIDGKRKARFQTLFQGFIDNEDWDLDNTDDEIDAIARVLARQAFQESVTPLDTVIFFVPRASDERGWAPDVRRWKWDHTETDPDKLRAEIAEIAQRLDADALTLEQMLDAGWRPLKRQGHITNEGDFHDIDAGGYTGMPSVDWIRLPDIPWLPTLTPDRSTWWAQQNMAAFAPPVIGMVRDAIATVVHIPRIPLAYRERIEDAKNRILNKIPGVEQRRTRVLPPVGKKQTKTFHDDVKVLKGALDGAVSHATGLADVDPDRAFAVAMDALQDAYKGPAGGKKKSLWEDLQIEPPDNWDELKWLSEHFQLANQTVEARAIRERLKDLAAKRSDAFTGPRLASEKFADKVRPGIDDVLTDAELASTRAERFKGIPIRAAVDSKTAEATFAQARDHLAVLRLKMPTRAEALRAWARDNFAPDGADLHGRAPIPIPTGTALPDADTITLIRVAMAMQRLDTTPALDLFASHAAIEEALRDLGDAILHRVDSVTEGQFVDLAPHWLDLARLARRNGWQDEMYRDKVVRDARTMIEIGDPSEPKWAHVKGNGLTGNARANGMAADAVAIAMSHFPADMLARLVRAFPEGIDVVASQRGFCSPVDTPTGRRLIIGVSNIRDQSTAGDLADLMLPGEDVSVAAHELFHGLQYTLWEADDQAAEILFGPHFDPTVVEGAFLARRTEGGFDAYTLRRIYEGLDELGSEDEFANIYMGKSTMNEALTMLLQGLLSPYGPEGTYIGGRRGNQMDLDALRFVLGVLGGY